MIAIKYLHLHGLQHIFMTMFCAGCFADWLTIRHIIKLIILVNTFLSLKRNHQWTNCIWFSDFLFFYPKSTQRELKNAKNDDRWNWLNLYKSKSLFNTMSNKYRASMQNHNIKSIKVQVFCLCERRLGLPSFTRWFCNIRQMFASFSAKVALTVCRTKIMWPYTFRPIYIGKNQNPKNLGFLLYRLHCQKNP